MKSPWHRWSLGTSWSSRYAEVIRAEAAQWAALSKRRRQRLRLGVIYSGWHSSLIVSNGVSWPQHDKAKCGSERGQDSYLVPMLSYLPYAILDILRDLLHPALLASSPPLWGLGYVKSQGGERMTKLAIPASVKLDCSLWSMWPEKREGGFSGCEICFLAGWLYTKTLLNAVSYIYCLFITVFQSFLPLQVGLERQTYLLTQSDFWIFYSTSGFTLYNFSWHFLSFSKSLPLWITPYLSSVIGGAFGTHQ